MLESLFEWIDSFLAPSDEAENAEAVDGFLVEGDCAPESVVIHALAFPAE